MESIPCAICAEDDTALLFTKWGHNIVKCRKCDLSYVNPRSFRVEADDYFKGAYLSTIEENGALKPGIELLYSEIAANLETYLKPGRLLDVGCAMGHFMAFAQGRGWNVHGVECSGYAANYGRKQYGLKIQSVCDVAEARLPDNYFDACVLIEVAEHLPYPRKTFADILRLLKPGGMLYVTTPNFASFGSLLRREDWTAVIPTGRLYHFDANSLARLLTSVGFTQVIDLTSPADFDSELNQIRSEGGLRISAPDLEYIRRSTTDADVDKITNGRGEGLVVCAVQTALRTRLHCCLAALLSVHAGP